MARRKPALTVTLAPEAENELDEIYRYNIKKRGLRAANGYITFLRSQIAGLAFDYDAGKPIEGRPDLRFVVMKRTGRWKDGHIAVFIIDEALAMVEILHIFHTKQDWENKL